MGLHEKIYSVMSESEGLEKNLQVGSGANGYKAVGEAEVLNMLKPLFKKHKLIVFPIDGEMTETNFSWDTTYKDNKETKTRNVTQLKVKFKIVDVDTGESEILAGFGNGADSQDKGSGKAFTYAFKTMLNKTFMLFSGEDADNDHSDDLGKNESSKPEVGKTSNTGKQASSQGKATKEQVAEIFKLGNEKKKEVKDFDIFAYLEKQENDGKITTRWTYSDKAKTVINWTVADYEHLKNDLQLPF